jgi:hypothetical protein
VKPLFDDSRSEIRFFLFAHQLTPIIESGIVLSCHVDTEPQPHRRKPIAPSDCRRAAKRSAIQISGIPKRGMQKNARFGPSGLRQVRLEAKRFAERYQVANRFYRYGRRTQYHTKNAGTMVLLQRAAFQGACIILWAAIDFSVLLFFFWHSRHFAPRKSITAILPSTPVTRRQMRSA